MVRTETLNIPGYQVMQFLGSGARSTIWQIRDHRNNELFALKRVVRRTRSDTRYLEQAINEYQVGSRINHPIVRRVLEIRRLRRWLSVCEIHLVMELCRGQSVQSNRPASIAASLEVFSQVAKGLAHMNARGFVHADMKPNNIIVARNGTVKIIDLGQSCPIGTVKQRIQGTPDFIAPEQVHRRPLDARTDVFNFGAALYWTVTGRPIPTALPRRGEVTLRTEQIVVPPDQINPDVPRPVARLISDCIEPVPANRPDSMSDVASCLGLILHSLSRDGAQASGA